MIALAFFSHGALQATPAVYSAPARSENATARLVLDDGNLRAGETRYVGLQIETAPGWHTYWENPGDSGLATRIRWRLPPGITAGPILWPTPRRISAPPLMSYGYGEERATGQVMLLTQLTVASDAPAGAIQIGADVEWLECKEICLPGEGKLELRGRVVAANAPAVAPVSSASDAPNPVTAARAHLPRGIASAPIPVQARAQIQDETIHLTISDVPNGIELSQYTNLYFFVEHTGLVAHAEPQIIERSDDRISIRIPRDLAANQLPAGPDAEIRGILRLEPDPNAADTATAATARAGADAIASSVVTEAWYIRAPIQSASLLDAAGELIVMFVLALAGGLLLNLMPCVLPVLSLKVLALIQHGGESARQRLISGLAFAAGVVVSFLSLAGVLLILQSAGAAVGWGYQLQSPGFVLILLLVVSAFALNLVGVYEIGGGWLAGIATTGTRLVSTDASATRDVAHARDSSGTGRLLRHAGAGVLATVLATPCTAPFMGTAMGFAFTRSPAVVLIIFAALGIGMALPYLIFAAFPRALAWLPKPGRWMESFKHFTGFLLFATSLWLLWIFGRLTGPDAHILALVAVLLLAFVAYLYGRELQGNARSVRGRWFVRALCIVLLVGVGVIGWFAARHSEDSAGVGASSAKKTSDSRDGEDWEQFSPSRLAELRAAGRPVLIDFTADWCLSCKVNEALTFRSAAVWRRMRELDVVALKADWTRRDPEITNALRSYGRSGVPLYVLYGPGPNAPARLLPEVLSEGLFLAELEKLRSTDVAK